MFNIANKNNDLLCNEQIKNSQVLVIGPNGEQLGVKAIKDALTIASYAGLDLVLINSNSNPGVCKIMDYNKYKYEKAKKQKEATKKQKASNMELKEYRLSPVIDIGDFNKVISCVESNYDSDCIYDKKVYYMNDIIYLYDRFPFIDYIKDITYDSNNQITQIGTIKKEEIIDYIKTNNIRIGMFDEKKSICPLLY